MIKVYTKNNCPKCDMTKRILDSEGIEFQAINTDEDKEAYNEMKEIADKYGFMSMPIVVADGKEPFSDFRPEKLQELK